MANARPSRWRPQAPRQPLVDIRSIIGTRELGFAPGEPGGAQFRPPPKISWAPCPSDREPTSAEAFLPLIGVPRIWRLLRALCSALVGFGSQQPFLEWRQVPVRGIPDEIDRDRECYGGTNDQNQHYFRSLRDSYR